MAFKGKIMLLSHESGGRIDENETIMDRIHEGHVSSRLIRAAKYGTPVLKISDGISESPKVMLTAGIHGNEFPPQIAALRLVDEIEDLHVNGTVYIIPFAVPHATMKNSRKFKGIDMNRTASKGGSISNNILKATKTFKVDSVADFHATKPRSNPGVESVFCSKEPCSESFTIAKYITDAMSSKLLSFDHAATLYSGALEDECNMQGIPAVTCEVVSENCEVKKGSPEKSYLQMLSYLRYFDIISRE